MGDKSKGAKSRSKKVKSKSSPCDLGQLRNIGKTIQQRLIAIVVTNEKHLRKMGAVKAYLKIREHFPKVSIPVCYYLYSLQGALMNCHWDALPDATKARLRKRAGLEKD